MALTYDTSLGKVFFKLSAASSDFSIDSVTVVGGTLRYFGGVNDSYAAFFYPLSNRTEGNASIRVASGAFTDASGKANADGADDNNTISIPIPPTIALTYEPSSSRVNFKLSGASPNFSLDSVKVTGGQLKYFGGANDTYAAMFFPDDPQNPNGTIQVASAAFTDAAGNANADGADANNTVTTGQTTATTGTSGSKNDNLPVKSDAAAPQGSEGHDLLLGAAGDNTLNGGPGIDTLQYAEPYASFSVSAGPNDTLKLTSSKFGSDSISGVERFKFSDIHFANDLSGSAGRAAKVITAAFGKAYVSEFLAIGLTLADAGQDLPALCQTVTRQNLVELISGDSSTNGYVSTLFHNVVGRKPNVLELKIYASMIDDGSVSRQGLLEIAANHSMVSDTVNTLKVDLVGIPFVPGLQ